MEIPILFENKEVVVVNKPTGLMVHSDGRNNDYTLVSWVLEKYPEIENVGEEMKLQSGEVIKRPGIVHRLDKETSGVLIIAKTQDSFLNLKKQFQEREIKKVYNTFVYGGFKEEDGVIDRPIGKSKKDFRIWSAQRGARGLMREAVTEYRVVKQFIFDGETYSFVEVYPKTGRTHQIRVHMKAINHPIVCDSLYSPKRACLLGFSRLSLHSKSIEFSLLKGEKLKIEAELPEDFKKALNF
ncbi:RluA family pseudouridine synthase [Patescibacteria group bacterium]